MQLPRGYDALALRGGQANGITLMLGSNGHISARCRRGDDNVAGSRGGVNRPGMQNHCRLPVITREASHHEPQRLKTALIGREESRPGGGTNVIRGGSSGSPAVGDRVVVVEPRRVGLDGGSDTDAYLLDSL